MPTMTMGLVDVYFLLGAFTYFFFYLCALVEITSGTYGVITVSWAWPGICMNHGIDTLYLFFLTKRFQSPFHYVWLGNEWLSKVKYVRICGPIMFYHGSPSHGATRSFETSRCYPENAKFIFGAIEGWIANQIHPDQDFCVLAVNHLMDI